MAQALRQPISPFDQDIYRLVQSFLQAPHYNTPYRHWLPEGCLENSVLEDVQLLPLAQVQGEYTTGERAEHNFERSYVSVENRIRYPVCERLAQTFQAPEVIYTIESLCNINLKGSYLRIEIAQDSDGFWLKPHTDIGPKLFTMLLYVSPCPPEENWGTDIFASPESPPQAIAYRPNLALVFVPAHNTWHGFSPKPITGMRKSLIINYVTSEWNNRHELASPHAPIGLV